MLAHRLGVAEFITSNGESLVRSITSARDRFSTELQFEEAARQHQHLEVKYICLFYQNRYCRKRPILLCHL